MEYNNHNMKMMEEQEQEQERDKKRCYNKLLNDFVKDIVGNYQMLKVLTIPEYSDKNYDMVNPLFFGKLYRNSILNKMKI
jgi:hypothetical protein